MRELIWTYPQAFAWIVCGGSLLFGVTFVWLCYRKGNGDD